MKFLPFLHFVSPHLEMTELQPLRLDLPGILVIHTNVPHRASLEEAVVPLLVKQVRSPWKRRVHGN